MPQTVFVKVVGFSDVERHALNTVFRLSSERDTAYTLWAAGAPEEPKLALIDGQSYEAQVEVESPKNAELKIIWVGAASPPQAWRVYQRPLNWTAVVQAMDDLFAPIEPLGVDFDLDFDLDGPADEPAAEAAKRVLVINTDRDERLYLRAKCASVGLVLLDEATTGAEALELLKNQSYAAALLDLELPDMDGWQMLKLLQQHRPAVPHIVLTTANDSFMVRLRAWRADTEACLGKPLHPGRLHRLLKGV